MINQLIDIIGREALLFESFLELLEQQKRALVANDLSELNRLTRLQQEAVANSHELNEERIRTLALIKTERHFEDNPTISRIISIADSTQAARLRELRELLLALNQQILDVRNTNAFLINESRQMISRTMTMLSKSRQTTTTTYSRDAAREDQPHAVALDRRI